ncbi:MAG: thiamine-phosphate diphosphorylase [Deltaproteobacteria bacterium GWA2_54_12]|nr:MAG: thiamine-phosphate diphosphorylase [Deltaproteobacteria bacterium GWA2_54_12]
MSTDKIKGLYCVIDSAWVELSVAGHWAKKLVEAGVETIQLRAKDEGSRAVLEAACGVRAATKGKALFIVNDRLDIALLCGADGVHLGQDDIPLTEARRLMPSAIIGVSTHNLEEAREAETLGADYISYGPIFQTKTKKDADIPKGLEGLRALAPCVGIPIVAIGGITIDSAVPVLEAGATSVAVISDILLAEDIGGRALEIISRIRRKGA